MVDLMEVISTHLAAESASVSPAKRAREPDCENCLHNPCSCSCSGSSSVKAKAMRLLPSADSETTEDAARRTLLVPSTMMTLSTESSGFEDDTHIMADAEAMRAALTTIVTGAALEASWLARWRPSTTAGDVPGGAPVGQGV